ncbi:MAG TPA: histidinol-phosphatase [Gaiellaceae bacterium]|nr:histidinol-phosphatase [Gaiellaceae bacterium]
MIVDYHMHLRRGESDDVEMTDHSLDAVERYVAAARAVGVDEIGISEHVYYFRETRHLWHMPYHLEHCVCELEPYLAAIDEAKRRGLPVKLGIEVDYEPAREDDTRAWLGRHEWDFVLGSIHFVDGLGIDSRPRLIDEVGVEETWRRYFDALAAAAASGLFDSLAHPDLVKMWGDRPAPQVENELFERFADDAAAAGVCVEVSTRGLLRPVAEPYPDRRLLVACRERDVPVTLASDAHSVDRVGWRFDEALALMRRSGYETLTVFERREPRQVALA